MAQDFHEIRRNKGISQIRLATLVQEQSHLTINPNVLSTWERGHVRHPRYDYVAAVARALEMTPQALYEALDESWNRAHPPDDLLIA